MLSCLCTRFLCFFFKQKTAYEMRISDWSSDVCSSDLLAHFSARTADIPPQLTPKRSLIGQRQRGGKAGKQDQGPDQRIELALEVIEREHAAEQGYGSNEQKSCVLVRGTSFFSILGFHELVLRPRSYRGNAAWQGGRVSNPQPAVLETAALPVELPPCIYAAKPKRGADFRQSAPTSQRRLRPRSSLPRRRRRCGRLRGWRNARRLPSRSG